MKDQRKAGGEVPLVEFAGFPCVRDQKMFFSSAVCCVVSLFVVPPRNLVIDIQKEIAVEGEEIELNCTAMASRPATTIRWFKGNKELTGRCSLSVTGFVQSAGMIYVAPAVCSLLPL